MWFDEATNEWKSHPDCTCGQGSDYKLRAINRPCYCPFLRPLGKDGKPLPSELFDGIRAAIVGAKER